MSVLWNENGRTLTLQTESTSYQMKIDEYQVLLHTYYGRKIEDSDLSYMTARGDRGFSGCPYEAGNCRSYSLDTLPQEYGAYGTGDYRTSAIKVRHADGSRALSLRYVSHEIEEGKYGIPGLPAVYAQDTPAQTLTVTLKDTASPVYVKLYYGVMEKEDVITRAVEIVNEGGSEIYLEKVLSVCMDYQYGKYDLITFYGKHAMERELSRQRIHHGIQSIGSSRGASSHHYNPFMILADPETTETQGDCYGFSFVYSGDFIGEAELDQMNQTRVVMGLNPDNFTWKLEPGESFRAPEVIMGYSSGGLGKLSRIYHRALRYNVCRGKYKTARRPILINNWEGTYFDFNAEKLIQIAKEAHQLGVELFVMDDGWFGKRDDDISGLGDWHVNEEKLGCTLKEMADEICKTGMQFGIWFEPECVSEDSDLYREHPDWALAAPGRAPMRGRYQLVLDFSRKEVRDNIYGQLCRVLDSAPITYVKWDFNRHLSDIYSAALPADRQGETAHRYVLGLYEVLENLTRRYPDILFEGCSGGGGRFDAGMLYYTPQIWCSDDTDAIERIRIQYGTSFGYPVSAVGAHVSACPNHQTGRVTPLSTRAVVAMAGTFGYELDVEQMTLEDKAEISSQIEMFKKHYSLIQEGDYYRITDPYEDEAYAVWELASGDGGEALLSVVAVRVYANQAPVFARLKGLDEKGWYTVNGSRDIYPGGALMYCGLRLPAAEYEYQSWLIEIKRI